MIFFVDGIKIKPYPLRMSNSKHVTNQNLTNIHRTAKGSLVGYHKPTKRWFIHHESQHTGGWLPW